MGITMKKLFYLLLLVPISFLMSCDDNGDLDSPRNGGNASEFSENPSGQGGSLARFSVFNNHLYAVNWNTLNTFDITDQFKPSYIGNTQIGNGIETIFTRQYDSILFIGSQTGMLIYDADDPVNPTFLSSYEHIMACDPVVANDKYAFVTLNSDADFGCFRGVDQLEIVNIEDLRNPYEVATYPMESPKGLGIDDSLLFICDRNLKVYDATDVNNLKNLSNHDVPAFDVIPGRGVEGNILFVIGDGGLYQYQYTDGEMELLSNIPLGS